MSSVSTSPWAVATPVATKSFADIMSEELVMNEMSAAPTTTNLEDVDYIYNEEDFMTVEELAAKRQAEAAVTSNEDDFVYNEDDFLTDEEKADRDFALALAAQEEESVIREKKDPKYGNSKVNVCASLLEHFTYGNGVGASQHVQESSDNFEAEELGAKLMGQGAAFKNGVANVDGTRVSKHDSLIDGLMNSMSLGEMDGAGDMAGLMVSNTVNNSLKNFSSKQRQKGVYVGGGGRVSAKDSRSTSEAVLDENTRLLLFKLIQKSVFDEVHGVVKTGKESNVYHATKNRVLSPQSPSTSSTPSSSIKLDEVTCRDQETEKVLGDLELKLIDQENEDGDAGSVASSVSHLLFENSDFDYHDVAVKVFKTTLNEFSNRIDYIKGDHRFSRERYAKNSNNKRKFIAQVYQQFSLNILY
mmetsp:Transcript_18857/g.31468  ORF Transcript_18857/g.31468 Transcript_18857/m.31468 type:complete len:415 (+) Transcript_18857:54-1298(+)